MHASIEPTRLPCHSTRRMSALLIFRSPRPISRLNRAVSPAAPVTPLSLLLHIAALATVATDDYTDPARWRRSGDRSSGFPDGRKVRTPRAGRWVTPRRSDPTPAPQRTDRRWPRRHGPHIGRLRIRQG